EPLAARPGQKPPNRKAEAGQPGGSAATQPELARQNLALETELAAVKKELDARKSEISFSYGSVRDSGRFVGMTFRKMFETAAAREATEVQARMADNQINVLSLGPFIQDADVIESDPVAFAQFQGALISQVLGLPEQQGTDVEALLRDLKTKSLKVETGSPEWAELNDAALKSITALLPEADRQALRGQLDFFQQYGVLMIPAYAILRAPTPTVVMPPAVGTTPNSAK
ncbi:MAG TPA: hypothetical protein VKC51_05030, partial [Lacunisphaera sp.]|nr:hypothetical protein [Lacunisphaera sp.]